MRLFDPRAILSDESIRPSSCANILKIIEVPAAALSNHLQSADVEPLIIYTHLNFSPDIRTLIVAAEEKNFLKIDLHSQYVA